MLGGSFQEIFGSLTIGIIITSIAFFLIYQVNGLRAWIPRKPFFDWALSHLERIRSTGNSTLVVGLILIYAVGQLIEDVSDNLIDNRDSLGGISRVLSSTVPSEPNIRLKTIVNFSESGTELTKLGDELFQEKGLLQEAILKVESKIHVDQDSLLNYPEFYLGGQDEHQFRTLGIQRIINSIYFRAKNWCYSQDNYFQELELIQARVDFSRSTYVILIFFLLVSLLVLILQSIFLVRRKKPLAGELKKQKNVERKQVLYCILIALSFIFISRFAYVITEQNFDKRAVGYYLSHVEENKGNTQLDGAKLEELQDQIHRLDSTLQEVLEGKQRFGE